jgi:hypothetical protein
MQYNIVRKALQNLEQTTDIKGKWKAAGKKKGKAEIDGTIELVLEGKTFNFCTIIKNNLRSIHIENLIETALKNKPLLVLADQIYPSIKEELRAHNIAYIETCGNIYLKQNSCLYWIETNKAIPAKKQKNNRAFTKTGLRLVFDILNDENELNNSYRELAKKANIALGNVNYIINGLKENGFVVSLNKETLQLTNKKELLDTWANKYLETLKNELVVGTYRFVNQNDFLNWKKIKLDNTKTVWGGEAAGDLLTKYLKAAKLTLYTTETQNELFKKYRLIPDPKGSVDVYHKFWNDKQHPSETAPALLVYADLINTNDTRCLETANKIYEKIIQN